MSTRSRTQKKEYEEALNIHTVDMSMRKRIDEMRSGKKATKYFCNLMKNTAAQKYIPKLINEDGTETQSQGEVEESIRNFYQDLYSNQDNELLFNNIEEFMENETIEHRKISDREKERLEDKITIEELGKALKGTTNESSPGATGFMFFKMSWPRLKYIIHAGLKKSFEDGELPKSLSRGIITLIPKGNKDQRKITNWRPITLLDCLYKIQSTVIARQLAEVLPGIIHDDQCGFVPGRYIGKCIRNTANIMDWLKRNNKEGLILIDFKRAFDSISFRFIEQKLKFFCF